MSVDTKDVSRDDSAKDDRVMTKRRSYWRIVGMKIQTHFVLFVSIILRW